MNSYVLVNSYVRDYLTFGLLQVKILWVFLYIYFGWNMHSTLSDTYLRSRIADYMDVLSQDLVGAISCTRLWYTLKELNNNFFFYNCTAQRYITDLIKSYPMEVTWLLLNSSQYLGRNVTRLEKAINHIPQFDKPRLQRALIGYHVCIILPEKWTPNSGVTWPKQHSKETFW